MRSKSAIVVLLRCLLDSFKPELMQVMICKQFRRMFNSSLNTQMRVMACDACNTVQATWESTA